MSDSLQDSVAICGFSFRLPGGANTPEKLWEILSSGRQCWTDVPDDRYNWKAFHNDDADARGTHNARGGFFLDEDVSHFDAQFFGISSAEAAAIDPQQRMLLEVSYEALENAGMPTEGLKGSQTGVYVALVSRDYDRQIYRDTESIPRHHLTGCGDATACGRISYCFDFRGPSMSLDTGCSGGMVAVHLACQALLLGEAKMALVGGTNLLLGPDMTVAMSNLHMINDNGRCYPFDNRGSGYGRAEGVAVMVLKKLSDAMRDGDDIRAVIRGSGVGQDGKTNGILLPSSQAQQQLTESVYKKAGLDPQDVGYIEAHGTGTLAGDAAEITSIREVFVGDQQRRRHPLFVGSIKANLGHSESTSGLAGIIKAVLCLEKSLIPPVAELVTVKEDVARIVQDNGITINRKLQSWPHTGVRRASVNSFGFGGTNAHVILENAPGKPDFSTTNGVQITNSNGIHKLRCQDLERHSSFSKPQLFIVSSRSKASLVRTIENLKTWIVSHGQKPGQLQNLAQTLSAHRSALSWRSSIVGSPHLNDTLSAVGRARLSKVFMTPHVVFLFTGQGAQYAGMGRELLSVSTVFLNSLQKSQSVLKDLGASWNLLEELQAPDSSSRINSSELSQPATTAIQIAVVDLLQDLDVRPAAVLGHSSGEVGAAYACGALTREDAMQISYYKGFVAGWCKEVIREKGAMIAVGLAEAEVARYLKLIQADRASIACVNSPSSVTVSGDESAILELKTLLDKEAIFNRLLKVDIAYHSQHMFAVSGRFEESISNLSVSRSQLQVKFFSSVSARLHESNFTPSYWVDNLVSKVRFSESLELLVENCRKTGSEPISFLEIGPHAALQGPVRQTMSALKSEYPKWSYSSSLVRGHDAHTAILGTLGGLFEQGVPLNLTKSSLMHPDEPFAEFQLVKDLSSYAWDHSSHWHESRLSKEHRFRRHAPHDLMGLRMTGTTTLEPIFRHILSVEELPWLREHMIDGFALYPGSAFLIQAIQGLKQLSQDRGERRDIVKYVLKGMNFSKALVVPNSPATVEVLLSFKPSRSSNERLGLDWQEFRVSSQSHDGTWNEHCNGLIRAIFESEKGARPNGTDREEHSTILKKRIFQAAKDCDIKILPAKLYEDLRRNGVDYGENFAIIKNLLVGDRRAIGTVQIPDIQKCMSRILQPHVIHPAVFDAFMHIALPLYHRRCSEGPVMLTYIGEAVISAEIFKRPGDRLIVDCELTQAKQRFGAVNVSIYQGDAQGRMLEVGSLTQEEFRSIGEGRKESNPLKMDNISCYKIDWVPIDRFKISPSRFDLESVKFCSITQSGLTKDLANELASHFTDQRTSNTVHDFSLVDIGSVHVIIDDGGAAEFGSETPTFQIPGGETQLAGLTSIIWVTLDSTTKGGLSRVSTNIMARRAKQKFGGQKYITLTYQDRPDNTDVIKSLIVELIERSCGGNEDAFPLELDYAFENGVLKVPKMKLHGPSNEWLGATQNEDLGEVSAEFHSHGRALKLEFKTPGLLTSARFVDNDEAQTPLTSDEVEVKVCALAVNQTDVSISMGRADATETMPGEFAGFVLAAGFDAQAEYRQGDRVCGWGSMTAYANTARIKARLLHRISDSLSYVEAASIPLAFQTAYHTLVDIARLEASHKILIHGAAGGVGQAAIQIAQHIGAEVYATVGSEAKVQLLSRTLGVSQHNVFSNLSTAFQDDISRITKGNGVDVVLNCSAVDLNEASLTCIAEFGFLINVVKSSADLVSPSFRRNISIVSIDMAAMKEKFPRKLSSKFRKIMSLHNLGVLRPINSTVLGISDIVGAFKLVNSQKYAGKVVLAAEEGQVVEQSIQKPQIPKLNSKGTYIVLGGSIDMNLRLCIFFADRGAANIISIVFSHAGQQRELSQSQELRKRNVYWSCIDLQHSDPVSTRAQISKGLEGLAPVKGVFHIEEGFQDASFDDIACSAVLNDVEGKSQENHLYQPALFGSSFDFLITLSPIKSGQRWKECAHVACSTLHVESIKSAVTTITRSTRLRMPQNEVLRLLSSLAQEQDSPSIQFAQLCNLFDFCLTTEVTGEEPLELFIPGTDGKQVLFDWNDPLFSAISRVVKVTQSNQNGQKTDSIEQKLTHAEDEDQVYKIVADAVCEQLSKFCAIDRDELSMSTAIADVGLDSLLAIEFKNWVVRTIQAPMQTTEILDARSLHELVTLISKRSKLVVQPSEPVEPLINGHTENHQSTQTNGDSSIAWSRKLPPLPIPNLDSLIERHLSYVKAFATNDEFLNTLRLAKDFKTPGNMGFALYQRLRAMKKSDPENWYYDLYLRSQYLSRKGALAPYMLFFFTHPVSLVKHSQPQRAALIASILIEYKRELDSCKVQPKIVNEQELCMSLYENLFNTCRQPRQGLDTFKNYPGNDFFVVLRRGHVYKIEFPFTGKSNAQSALENTFQSILKTSREHTDWLGVLTADHRISWAKNYEKFLQISPENADYIATLEKSAFLICLDDGAPENAEQRARQVHFSDGSNRWFDKSIQYVVCANGISGIVADHTGLDAPTVQDINMSIAAAIQSPLGSIDRPDYSKIAFNEIKHSTNAEIEIQVEKMRAKYQNIIAGQHHFFPTPIAYGASFMKSHKVPANSGFQMVVQLAARYFFGYSPAAWETVLQSTFHKGRVEINQIVTEKVAKFVTAVFEDTVPLSVCKRLLIDAALAHSGTVLACTRAGGSDRFMCMLREIIEEGEEEPALYSDPVYKRSRPRKMMSSCFRTHMAENGCVMKDEDAIWLHFEVELNSVKFCGLGLEGERFAFDLHKAAEKVRRILDA